TITLIGVMDKNIWPALQAAAAVLLGDHPAGIIIDCGSITRITPAGIGTFADAFRYITQKDAGIILVSASEEIITLARATEGVRSKMPLADSPEEARHSLKLRESVIRIPPGRNNLVIPLWEGWESVLNYAVRLRRGKEYAYHAAAVIKLPLSLSISHPMPREEQQAEKDLQKAAELVEGFGETVCARHTLRVRTPADIFGRFRGDRLRFLIPDAVLGAERRSRGPLLRELLCSSRYTVDLFSVKGSSDPDKVRRIMTVYGPGIRRVLSDCRQLAKVSDDEHIDVLIAYPVQVPRSRELSSVAPDEDFYRAEKEIGALAAKYKNLRLELRFLAVRNYASDLAMLAEKEQTELFFTVLESPVYAHSQSLRLVMNLYYGEVCSVLAVRG
ncbi:MAG: hypothetical protein IJT95_01005, partial [Abditibacteriota bacterium]|nr:hypothetical protein [Abditibacteriota bacterium]